MLFKPGGTVEIERRIECNVDIVPISMNDEIFAFYLLRENEGVFVIDIRCRNANGL